MSDPTVNWCLYTIHSWQEKTGALWPYVDILQDTYNQSWHSATLGLDLEERWNKTLHKYIFHNTC